MASTSPATLLSFLFLLILLFSPAHLSASQISLPPASSPLAADAPTPSYSSPPSPSPHSLVSSPSPSQPIPPTPAPAPAPTKGEAMEESGHSADIAENDIGKEGGGMSGGKKAGIAFGVIVAAAAAGLAGWAYKKRRDNIRRSRYSYASMIQL